MNNFMIGVWMMILGFFGFTTHQVGLNPTVTSATLPSNTQQVIVQSTTSPSAVASNTQPITTRSITDSVPLTALQACANKSPGSACTASIDQISRTGFCVVLTGSTTACALPPEKVVPTLQIQNSKDSLDGIPEHALQACANKSPGSACTEMSNNKQQVGTCLSVNSSTSACSATVPH